MCNKTKKAPVQEFFLVGKNNKVSCATAESKSLSSSFGSEAVLSLFVGMAHRSNNASPEELTKVLSLLQKKPPQSTFYSMTTEQQIAEKEDLLTEMILLSARPTISWVSAALKMVWQRSEVENIDRFVQPVLFSDVFASHHWLVLNSVLL